MNSGTRIAELTALRGKAKTAAIQAFWLDRAAIEGLASDLKNLTTKQARQLEKFAVHRVWDHTFADPAVRFGIAALASDIPRIRVMGIAVLGEQDGRASDLTVPAVLAFIEQQIGKPGLEIMGGFRLLRKLGVGPDAIRAAADPFLQHPDHQVARPLRSLLGELGHVDLEPYRYDGFGRDVAKQLLRLGAHVDQSQATGALPSFYSTATKQSWNGVDPKGECAAAMGQGARLYRQVSFPAGREFFLKPKGDDRREFHWARSGENLDYDPEGSRTLFAYIGYDSLSYQYAVDLKAEYGECWVCTIHASESYPSGREPLGKFLARLKPNKKKNDKAN